MTELGPFRVMSDGKTLFRNPYAWNQAANVLFLESPAGVGFSYSNTTADYAMSGDARTAEDSFVFLVNWFERFPEYRTRDFYISGESYAGHYVPQLAAAIRRHNQKNASSFINLKGIAVGNAVLNDPTDNHGMYDFFWTHALTSDENHAAMDKYCDFSRVNGTVNAECEDTLREADVVMHQLDIYNIYGPLCFGNLTRVPKTVSIDSFDPCSNVYVQAYLNDPAVQKAMHANVTGLDFPWVACSNVLPWKDSVTTVLPLLEEFMASGMRVWVFSGDNDGIVPVTSTRYSINSLNLTVKAHWQPRVAADELGGYSVVYKGDLTLVTVRGSGHEVPSFRPLRALVLIQSFLQGKPLPPYVNH